MSKIHMTRRVCVCVRQQ
uniref:Uncharacterized protein n=1 Tax=Anguilla anguilla TaxID=7936 RepID=A0A0E9PVW5_ANGAN